MSEVIQKSSNVGTVKMAMQMQPREMWDLYTQVGFGQKPQIAFPGAVTGRLRPYKTWRPIEQATMSYGYGLSAVLFQLARAYTVFAHDGELLPVTLQRETDLPADQRVAGLRVLSDEDRARRCARCCSWPPAPAARRRRRRPWATRSAARPAPRTSRKAGGYAEKKYRAWFVGMAPINEPRIVVAVMVDEPNAGKYFGGDVAAPVFSRGRAADAAHDGRAARPGREAADRQPRRPGRVEESF